MIKHKRDKHYIGGHYCNIHEKIRLIKKKPKRCERCHQIKSLELANISGKYIIDPNDFEWICRRCHIIGDGRIENLVKAQMKSWRKFIKEQNKAYIKTCILENK